MEYRAMTTEDYDKVYALWESIEGFALQSLDDSKEAVAAFLKRNAGLSVVAQEESTGEVIGSLLCGHDGRRATFYHVCVKKEYRARGIGQKMTKTALKALEQEKISKVHLVAFTDNELGNRFWKGLGWGVRRDVNYYDFVLNKENIIHIQKNRQEGIVL